MAFHSFASNLVGGDTNAHVDVFVRDRLLGSTERVSLDSHGVQGNGGGSYSPAISADGRFVAFFSYATNLVPGDTNAQADIFVRDRAARTTTRVSVSTAGEQGNTVSSDSVISGDGRFVAFISRATNLVSGDTNAQADIFVHDRAARTTTRVSVSSAGAQGDGPALLGPAISADGRFVAFDSYATTMVENDTNAVMDVFVHDRVTATTTRVSLGRRGAQGDNPSLEPSISADGRFVAFTSYATNLVTGDTNVRQDIFVYDRRRNTTARMSISNTGGQANGDSSAPSVSGDGRFIAFRSFATNLIPGDNNQGPDIFVRDRLAGATWIVSVSTAGAGGNDQSWSGSSISGDGRLVSFASEATNLVAGDSNGVKDVFVRDRGPQPDKRNDLLVDFGTAGLFRFLNNATWTRIRTDSPIAIAAGDLDGTLIDEMLVSISGQGLFARFNNATRGWTKLHNLAPARLVTGDFDGNGVDEIAAAFGSTGLYLRINDAWRKLQGGTLRGLAVGDLDGNGKDELIVDLNGKGLIVLYNQATWQTLSIRSSGRFAAGDFNGNGKDDLAVDFGSSGLWIFFDNTRWAKVSAATTQSLTTGDLDGNGKDELVVDFGTSGLKARYNNAGAWITLSTTSPVRVLVRDLDHSGKADVVADLGSKGIRVRYNNVGSFVSRRAGTAQGFTAGRFD